MDINKLIAELSALQKGDMKPEVVTEMGDLVLSVDFDPVTNQVILIIDGSMLDPGPFDDEEIELLEEEEEEEEETPKLEL